MTLVSKFSRQAIAVLTAMSMLLPLLSTQPAKAATDKTAQPLSASVQADINRSYGQLPMSFVPNLGQTDKRVQFTSRGPGYSLFIAPTETVLVLSKPQATNSHKPVYPSSIQTQGKHEAVALRMSLVGANPKAQVLGQERQAGEVNYLLGQDTSKWRIGLSTYARVQTEAVWPGIDMVHYGNGQELEYDFVLAPGAEVSRIAMEVAGAEAMRLDKEGNLLIGTSVGEVRQARPVVYQQVGKDRREVAGRYVLEGKRVSFAVGKYDRELPLVIDPVLVYSTYLGGNSTDIGYCITVGSDGSAYLTGRTDSTDYPITSGALDTSVGGNSDLFVTKLNATGNALLYSTYLGGSNYEMGRSIAVGSDGSAYITGTTSSTDYPTTSGAYDTSYNSGSYDVFVTKLSAAGNALLYSTFLGGSNSDYGYGIAVGSDGSTYLTGFTFSTDYPTTTGALDTSLGGGGGGLDVFVTKLNAAGDTLVYSTYLGGSGSDLGYGIAVGSDGSAYLTGTTSSTDYPITSGALDTSVGGNGDLFVTKLNATGNALLYSTYLGGSSDDLGYGIAVGSDGSAYITGTTSSTDYPTTSGAYDTSYNSGSYDVFVTKLSAAGDALLYSTYLGGSSNDFGYGIAVGSDGSAYLTGFTTSTDYPTTTNAYDSSVGGSFDVFVTKLSVAGNALLYSTYLGGSSDDVGYGIAVSSNGSAYITGYTTSTDYPTTSAAYDTSFGGSADAFVTRLTLTLTCP